VKHLRPLIRQIIPKKYHTQFTNLYMRCKYFGFKFKCPFCEGHFRKLLPAGLDLPILKEKNVVGGGYRLNGHCPSCYSSDRERLIYLYLKNKTNFFYENLKVLHVAPEQNLQKVFMAWTNIDYLSSDFDSPLAMINMDITKIPYEDNSFDVIICNHVLEHIPNDRQAMSELYRVLRPGGWSILQVPISLLLDRTYEDPTVIASDEREKKFGQSDHVRIYAKDYKDRLESVGFTVEVYSFGKEFGDSTIHKYALLKDEDIYLASKSWWPTTRVGSEEGTAVID
jgi:predicted SAM-dependent methyltransferase